MTLRQTDRLTDRRTWVSLPISFTSCRRKCNYIWFSIFDCVFSLMSAREKALMLHWFVPVHFWPFNPKYKKGDLLSDISRIETYRVFGKYCPIFLLFFFLQFPTEVRENLCVLYHSIILYKQLNSEFRKFSKLRIGPYFPNTLYKAHYCPTYFSLST